jgi:diacyltrehalose acyltransferase
MTAKVFMLGGAFSGTNNYMPTMLQGAITNGQTQVQVPYNNFGMFVSTVQQGAAMLDTYLHTGTGKMIAFGHSLGAVVCSYWLNAYAPTTTILPANLSFVFIGNSVSLYGGALGPETGALWQNWFGTGVTAPANTPFTVTDIKRQYDGWTDWPTGTMNFDAEFNAFSGQGSVHPNYQNVNPSPVAPGNVAYTPLVSGSPGNITYIWSMTQPIPLYGSTWNTYVSPLDQSIRPTVEAAYNRPVTVPTPTY